MVKYCYLVRFQRCFRSIRGLTRIGFQCGTGISVRAEGEGRWEGSNTLGRLSRCSRAMPSA